MAWTCVECVAVWDGRQPHTEAGGVGGGVRDCDFLPAAVLKGGRGGVKLCVPPAEGGPLTVEVLCDGCHGQHGAALTFMQLPEPARHGTRAGVLSVAMAVWCRGPGQSPWPFLRQLPTHLSTSGRLAAQLENQCSTSLLVWYSAPACCRWQDANSSARSRGPGTRMLLRRVAGCCPIMRTMSRCRSCCCCC